MTEGSRARDIVDSYPPTCENYDKAIACLKSRFGREELLIEFYIRELLNLVVKNVTEEKRIYSQLTEIDQEISSLLLEDTDDKKYQNEYAIIEEYNENFVKDGKKGWILLFTCAVYRAIHLELIQGLSTVQH